MERDISIRTGDRTRQIMLQQDQINQKDFDPECSYEELPPTYNNYSRHSSHILR